MKTSLITLLAAGTLMMAQPPGPGASTPNFDAVKTALGLTDAQVTSLNTLRQQEAQTVQTTHEQIAAKQTALRQMLTAGTTAQAAGQALLEIEALRKQIETVATRFRTQALNVLTAEQKTKLTALENAAKLRPAIGQATALNLIAPDPAAMPGGGPGFGGPRGFGAGPTGGPGSAGPMGVTGGRGPRGFGPPRAE